MNIKNIGEDIIYYVDALAGAGKTYALSEYAQKHALKGSKILFVQPTKYLIGQTNEGLLRSYNPEVVVKQFHGDVTDGSVIKNLTNYLNGPMPGGQIVFTTHSAFMSVSYIKKKWDWNLIIDEEINPIDHFCLNLLHNHQMVTNHIQLREYGPKYGLLKPNGSGLDTIVKNKANDQFYALVEPLAKKIQNDDWQVFVNQEKYHALITGEKAQLEVFSELKASKFLGFKKTIMASALFENTFTYHLFKKQGCIFRKLNGIEKNFRYNEHPNGHLINFYYLIDGSWSKNLRDKTYHDKGTIGETALEIAQQLFEGDIFSYLTNKDDVLNYKNIPNAVRLPNAPHGMNNYQHIRNFVCLSALNPSPGLIGFLRDKNLTTEEIKNAIYRMAAYQAFLRTAIRNPDDLSIKNALLIDKASAEWMAGLFQGSQVKYLPGLGENLCSKKRGRVRIHNNSADRKRDQRDREKRKIMEEITSLAPDSISNGNCFVLKKLCHENTFKKNYVTQILPHGTVFKNKHTKQGVALMGSSADFLDILMEMYKESYARKEDNFLISPAVFDPDKPDVSTSRGLENIEYLNGIWLDNDGGGISRIEFAKMFPFLTMYIFNTINSTPAEERWRVYIPTTSGITLEAQKVIIGQIKRVLKDNDYTDSSDLEKIRKTKPKTKLQDHGFDSSKFNGSSMFYAPCQAFHPTGSFFDIYDDQERSPLNVFSWIKNALEEIRDQYEYQADKTQSTNSEDLILTCPTQILLNWEQNKEGRIEKAIYKWRNETPKGSGRRKFFGLCQTLINAGLDKFEIEKILLRETNYARSPQERLEEIPALIENIQTKTGLHIPRFTKRKGK